MASSARNPSKAELFDRLKTFPMDAKSMHSADHYRVNQEPLWAEGNVPLYGAPEVEATIASLKQHFETVRQQEVKRLRVRLGQLSSTQENAIETLTHGLIDQILHAPITALKAAFEDSDSLAVIEAVHRVFNLSTGAESS